MTEGTTTMSRGEPRLDRENRPLASCLKTWEQKDNIWDLDRCLTGLWESEISEKLESWYGWALGKAGYVVYGPHIHRTLKSPRAGRGEIKSFYRSKSILVV